MMLVGPLSPAAPGRRGQGRPGRSVTRTVGCGSFRGGAGAPGCGGTHLRLVLMLVLAVSGRGRRGQRWWRWWPGVGHRRIVVAWGYPAEVVRPGCVASPGASKRCMRYSPGGFGCWTQTWCYPGRPAPTRWSVNRSTRRRVSGGGSGPVVAVRPMVWWTD